MIFGTSLRFLKNTFFSIRKMSLNKYVWIDLEMTGLNIEKDKILEVACIITTPDLKMLGEGVHLVVHQPDNVLENMEDWCKKTHSENKLIEACRNSTTTVKDAENILYNYIKGYEQENGSYYLCGNSVYMDRLFIEKYMPSVASILHYRLIDVSSIKVICSHWCPEKLQSFSKKSTHRALDDIKESIKELNFYKDHLFK